MLRQTNYPFLFQNALLRPSNSSWSSISIAQTKGFLGFEGQECRYTFNGQEQDAELAGPGNFTTAEFWEYDTRLGRRWNLDPIVKPWESPYAGFANNPIYFTDPSGLDPEDPKNVLKAENGEQRGKNGATYNAENDEWVLPDHKVNAKKKPTLNENPNQQSSKPKEPSNPKSTSPTSSNNTTPSNSSDLPNYKSSEIVKPLLQSKTNALSDNSTPWMNTALAEKQAGVKEIPKGSNSGPKVDVYLKYSGVASPNQWCAAFVHWCLGQNGIKGAGASGYNYLKWGVKLEKPKYGAIAVFKTGHVGFYMMTNPDGTIKIIHGNWGDRVIISSGVYDPIYPSQIKEYRFPIKF